MVGFCSVFCSRGGMTSIAGGRVSITSIDGDFCAGVCIAVGNVGSVGRAKRGIGFATCAMGLGEGEADISAFCGTGGTARSVSLDKGSKDTGGGTKLASRLSITVGASITSGGGVSLLMLDRVSGFSTVSALAIGIGYVCAQRTRLKRKRPIRTENKKNNGKRAVLWASFLVLTLF